MEQRINVQCFNKESTNGVTLIASADYREGKIIDLAVKAMVDKVEARSKIFELI